MVQSNNQIIIENAEILFRNFSGKEGMYNAEGDRNFCVLIDGELADQLIDDGWNVKELKPREEGEAPRPYIQVSVKYRGRSGAAVKPPAIVLITSRGRTSLDEDECEILDWVDIANVDLIIRPYEWAVNGKSGIKAYLKSIYLTIQEDELMQKYADIPEIEGGSKQLELEPGESDILDAEVVE